MKNRVRFSRLKCACVLAAALSMPVVFASLLRAQTDIPFRNPQGELQQINGPQAVASNAQSSAVLAQPSADLAGLEVVNKYPVPETLTFSTDQSVFDRQRFLTQNNTRSSLVTTGACVRRMFLTARETGPRPSRLSNSSSVTTPGPRQTLMGKQPRSRVSMPSSRTRA